MPAPNKVYWAMTLVMTAIISVGVGTTMRSPSGRELEARAERADKLRADLVEKLEASTNEVSRLRGRVMLENEERFEEKNGLQSSFDNCSEKDGVARCSARTDTGAPVSYYCTLDKCEIDCSFR